MVVSLAALLLVGVVAGAIAQEGGMSGMIQPIVIDIDQVVPSEVTMAVDIGDGEFVTVTTPITVNVALRVSIVGPDVVTVEPLPADGAGEIAMLGGVAWSVVSSENAGEIYDEDDNFKAIESNGGDLLVVVFSAENMSNDPVDLILGDYQDSIGDVRLVDDAGRTFAAVRASFVSQCDYATTAQPGIVLECGKVFEVPDGDADYAAFFFDIDGAKVGALTITEQ